MIPKIKPEERKKRIKKIQDEMIKRDLDAYLVHSTESDFANVLYLSGHRPVWETVGVLIPKEGESILLIGPEAEPFAEANSTIERIVKISLQHCDAYDEWMYIYMDDPTSNRILQAPYEVVQTLLEEHYDIFNTLKTT